VAAVFAATIAYRCGIYVAIHSGLLPARSGWATAVLPNFLLGRWSEYALGMVAAEFYRRGQLGLGAGRLRLAAVVAAAVGLLVAENPLKHVLFGLVFFALLCAVLAGDNVVARLFAWRPLVAVGVMSYSLYLVHQPLVGLLAHALGGGRGVDPRVVFLEQVALLPGILLVAFALFATVEWRSISRPGSARVGVRGLLFPAAARSEPAIPPGPLVTSPDASASPAVPVFVPEPRPPAAAHRVLPAERSP
jgi:peptidoglycan/LPS O-acetylase OafA/YrhL